MLLVGGAGGLNWATKGVKREVSLGQRGYGGDCCLIRFSPGVSFL